MIVWQFLAKISVNHVLSDDCRTKKLINFFSIANVLMKFRLSANQVSLCYSFVFLSIDLENLLEVVSHNQIRLTFVSVSIALLLVHYRFGWIIPRFHSISLSRSLSYSSLSPLFSPSFLILVASAGLSEYHISIDRFFLTETLFFIFTEFSIILNLRRRSFKLNMIPWDCYEMKQWDFFIY